MNIPTLINMYAQSLQKALPIGQSPTGVNASPLETSNAAQSHTRKRPLDASDTQDGVIDLTKSKFKNKKLSLSRKKGSPATQFSGKQHTTAGSDDDFQDSVNNYPPKEKSSASTPSPGAYQAHSNNDDSFSDLFPIETSMVCNC
jgi:hypothetical protein